MTTPGQCSDIDAVSYIVVVATPCSAGWELQVGGAGVTRCASLTQAPLIARDYLATAYGGDQEDYEVEVRWRT